MDFISELQRFQSRPWIGYFAAVFAVLLGTTIRLTLEDALVGYPFITYFLGVVFVSIIGTKGAAILTAVLSAVIANRFAVDSGGSIIPQSTSAWIGFVFFAIVCGVIIFLGQALTHALLKLSASEAALSDFNSELEARVAARTDEIVTTNALLIREAEAREVAESQVRQVQKTEAVGQLSGGIAHDFNNMLAIVIGSLDLMKRRIAKGETDFVQLVDSALDGAQRAATLTRRLLAFSRQQPLSPEVIDANGLARGMEDLLRRALGERISLEMVLGGGLWRTKIDPGQLENAILNLAVNARDAMPDGGRLTIETMNAHLDDAYADRNFEVAAGQYVVVAVSDSGIGMSADVMERVFDPFFTTKPVGEGTGLGLSQVHGFVKQSGGHVAIYSELGQGTTVKIYLRREHGALSKPSVDEYGAAQIPLGSTNEIVLVVEDDDAVRHASVTALRELGYTVRHASSGEEALAMFETQPGIALLFTDVVMPTMSGRQLAEQVASKFGPIKVIYTTGYTSNAIVHNGVVDHGVELIQKPFTLDQLARKVRKVLDAGQTASD